MSLVLISAAAVLAPLGAESLRRLRVPAVVLEIGLGIVIGPQVLGLAETGDLVQAFANLGLCFLMFLAGFDIDLDRVKGTPLTRAALGWASLPVFLALFLVVRGLPALLVYRDLPLRERGALAFFSATALPLVVVITGIGTATERMLPVNAAALVGAGMVSVLVYPLAAFGLLSSRALAHDVGDGDGRDAPDDTGQGGAGEELPSRELTVEPERGSGEIEDDAVDD